MKINKEWHSKNKIPLDRDEKIQWHVDHARECGCREIPQSIKSLMFKRKPKVIVSILVENKGKYLLVKELLEGGNEYWIVPGGKVEFGESLEDAARRELLEETGIKVKNLKYLTYKEAIFPEYNYHTVIFFFKTNTTQSDIKADIEGKVMNAKWFTKESALKLRLVETAEWLFRGFL